MRLIMLGTGPFAVPTFKRLLNSRHQVVALVTRPIEDPGRRRKTSANPMRDVADQAGIVTWDPADINTPDSVAQLQGAAADCLVVCDYGQILSPTALQSARCGGINLHGSLLPKFRGAAPIHWAIYRGETETGVSVIHMTPQLDGGPILAVARSPITLTTTTADLEPHLAELGVEPVLQSLELLEQWDGIAPLGTPQDPQQVTSARRLRKEDSRLRWGRSAVQLQRQVRAFQPWPGSFAEWTRQPGATPLRLILWQTAVVEADALPTSETPPGTVVRATPHELVLQTGRGHLSLETLQPAGKNPMPIAAFLRGYPQTVGQQWN